MTKHTCDAIVVSCIDFRFQQYIRNWLDKNIKDKTYDYVGLAGSTKELDIILKQIAISVRLHNIKEIILMHHEECGAYGQKSTKKKHASELKKAQKAITALYPTLKISLYHLHLNGTFEKINY